MPFEDQNLRTKTIKLLTENGEIGLWICNHFLSLNKKNMSSKRERKSEEKDSLSKFKAVGPQKGHFSGASKDNFRGTRLSSAGESPWRSCSGKRPPHTHSCRQSQPQKGMGIGGELVGKKGLRVKRKRVGEDNGGKYNRNTACTHMKLPK